MTAQELRARREARGDADPLNRLRGHVDRLIAAGGEPIVVEIPPVQVRIDNCYSDGHESSRTVEIEAPVGDLEEWWNDVVFDYTGDGHGAKHPKLGTCYTATVVDAHDPALVGEEYEWTS